MCKKHQPLASGVQTKGEPDDGDISICISCGEWNKFEGDKLVQPDDDDYEFIRSSPLCTQVRDAWIQMRKQQRAH